MKELMKKLFELAGNSEVVVFDTIYGALYAVKGGDIRMEHHFKGGETNFAMIVDANEVLFDAQL